MTETYDVVVVGCGPVGQTVAALLAKQGVDVGVYERFTRPYGLPRAIRFDHEAMRLWQALGMTDELLEDVIAVNRYEWFGADGDPIVRFDIPDGPSGWPFSYCFFQPYLESALERALVSTSAEVNRGWTLVGLTEQEAHVELEFHGTRDLLEDFGNPPAKKVEARYVIAADGARSTVRDLLGIEAEDLGFKERWCVVDIRPTDGSLVFPAFPQQFCDARRPHMWAPNGTRHRRWEFMLLPGEDADMFDDLDRVWSMLAPWINRDQGEIVRHAVYEFESKVATTMQSGRCFVAGDAAHLMPPHLGEGMCSGLRDASSLAWRLALVLQGRAGEALLDTYSSERLPHARTLVEQSQAMGRISCVLDPQAAAERDRAMRAAGGVEPWPFPRLGPGLHYLGPDHIESLWGRLSVQGVVRVDGRSGRLDDVVGRGFVLIARGVDLRQTLSAGQLEALEQLGCHIVGIGVDVEDVDGMLGGWLASEGAAAVLVRPDFYVFGAVRSTEAVSMMVDDLLAQIAPTRVGR